LITRNLKAPLWIKTIPTVTKLSRAVDIEEEHCDKIEIPIQLLQLRVAPADRRWTNESAEVFEVIHP
jgi:hypothetical protein